MNKNEKLQKYFNQKNKLTLENKKYLHQVDFLTSFFLEEDLDGEGDITTDLLIKENKQREAIVTAKADGIIAGIEEISWLLTKYNIHGTKYKQDGEGIQAGNQIIKLEGKIKDILKLERTILNLLQRMSGIATQTNKLVKKTEGEVLICPTRKTQWGLLDKKAVTLGGGGTHRLGLYDFVLIKDNHLKIQDVIPSDPPVGGESRDTEAKQRDLSTSLRFAQGDELFWEIECKTEEQVFEYAKLNPGAIMFDNFEPKEIEEIIKKLKDIEGNYEDIIFEASGGITEDNIAEYADTGVDVISLGALTHSTKALDISLNIN